MEKGQGCRALELVAWTRKGRDDVLMRLRRDEEGRYLVGCELWITRDIVENSQSLPPLKLMEIFCLLEQSCYPRVTTE